MTVLSPTDLEALLAVTHQALHHVGVAQDVWHRLRCTCGRSDCEIGDPTRHSVTLQLDALAAHWRSADATGEERLRLAGALRRIADSFGDPAAAAGDEDVELLLHRVRDAWLSRMGTPLGGAPDEAWMRELYRVEARNALLLDKLLGRLVIVPFDRLAAAGAAHARQRRARLASEGLAGCQRTLLAWLDDHEALPQRTLLQEHLLALIAEAPWSAGEAQDVARMAEDAATALLAFGIADDVWVQAAFGAMDLVVPFSSLRVALVLDDVSISPALAD